MATTQAPTYISLPAGSDLSTKQYYFCDITSGKLAVAGAGTRVAGVLSDDPAATDRPGMLQIAGVAKVLAGGTITSGAGVASDSAGKAVAATGSAFVVGISVSAATVASGEYVEVLLTGSSAVGQASGVEVVTAGALSLGTQITELSVTGTKAYTIAAPTSVGQTKVVRCTVAASIPAGTLTVSSPDDATGFVCPATFFFDNVGQLLVLEATSALKWRCIQKIRTGVKSLVVGTTVTTGICNMSHVNLSITGAVSSTTTMALPNGAAVGELLSITVSTAASIPSGDLGGVYVKSDGTAGTLIDGMAATTDVIQLMWMGAAYRVMSSYTAAVIA